MQGMPGGASIPPLPFIKKEEKRGKKKMLQRLYVNSVYFSHVYKSAEGAYGFTLQLITSHAVR